MAWLGWQRIIGATMGAALAATPVWAATASAERTAFAAFKRLDRSGTMSLGADDLAVPRAGTALFTLLDSNSDGILTAADGTPARRLLRAVGQDRLVPALFSQRNAPRMATILDADGDGRLSLAELRPSLAGNAPLPLPAPFPPAPEVVVVTPPRPCWLLTAQGTWITLPAWAPKCRLSP